MAKIIFTLHDVAREIRKAERKLRVMRSKVVKADQKKIDLNLRELERSYRRIRSICARAETRIRPPYGQWFTTKPS